MLQFMGPLSRFVITFLPRSKLIFIQYIFLKFCAVLKNKKRKIFKDKKMGKFPSNNNNNYPGIHSTKSLRSHRNQD